MTKLFGGVGSIVGSYLGWWIGSGGGIMTAFIVSMLGTGLGIYAGRRLAAHYDL